MLTKINFKNIVKRTSQELINRKLILKIIDQNLQVYLENLRINGKFPGTSMQFELVNKVLIENIMTEVRIKYPELVFESDDYNGLNRYRVSLKKEYIK